MYIFVKILYGISGLLIPCMIFYIVGSALAAKKNVYEDFTDGAREGLTTAVRLLPTLIGLLTAVGVLRASGFLDMAAEQLGKLTRAVGFPAGLVPLALVRLFSSSAAAGLLLDIYKQYGTDSLLGVTASLMMGCTETVFYTMTVYFTAARVTRTRYTLAGALLASAAGIAASTVLGNLLT